jgi:hypothetical protein
VVLSLIWVYTKPVLSSTRKSDAKWSSSHLKNERGNASDNYWSSTLPCFGFTLAISIAAVSQLLVFSRLYSLPFLYLHVYILDRALCFASRDRFNCGSARCRRWGGFVKSTGARLDTDACSNACGGGGARGDAAAAAIISARSRAGGCTAVSFQDRIVGGLLLEVFIPPVQKRD